MDRNDGLINILSQIKKDQFVLNQLLDNGMVNFQESSKETDRLSYFKNQKDEHLYYKRLFTIYFIISIVGFVFFYLYLTKEYYKELVEAQNKFIDLHNKDLDMIMKNINKLRIESYSIF